MTLPHVHHDIMAECPTSPPDAIILSGPDFYEAHIARLYGGYKRTQNLYGRATYQKDSEDVRNDAYIYFSLADRKWPGCSRGVKTMTL